MGYLAYPIPSELIPPIKQPLKDVINLVQDQIITSHNVLEMIVIFKFKIMEGDHIAGSKRLISSIEHYVNELALNNRYLTDRFFG